MALHALIILIWFHALAPGKGQPYLQVRVTWLEKGYIRLTAIDFYQEAVNNEPDSVIALVYYK